MPCQGNEENKCPIKNWCVCQWAFAKYLQKAGGCDKVQEIVCDATHMAAIVAYREKEASDAQIAAALECLEKRCSVASGSLLQSSA